MITARENVTTTGANAWLRGIWRPAVLVNSRSGNGHALRKWNRIRDSVLRSLPPDTPEVFLAEIDTLRNQLSELNSQGYNCLLIAGGDGTINSVVNELSSGDITYPEAFAIGGIGLGSSNDFLKPFNRWHRNIPVRINPDSACRHDVGFVEFVTLSGRRVKKYFLMNASVGVTAEANYLFNNGDGVIRAMKHRWLSLTIVYTALRAIIGFKKYDLKLIYDGVTYSGKLSNLAVLKRPFVSGSFRYEQKITHEDAVLGINYCTNMGRLGLIRTLVDLGRGKFIPGRTRFTAFTKELSVQTEQFIPLETDGEVMMAKDIHFSVSRSPLIVFMD